MARKKRFYWDACAWISYINQETDVPIGVGKTENRYAMCKKILESARRGDVEIVTSAFSLAEVYQRSTTDKSGLARFPAFLEQPYVLTIPVDLQIGQRANSMLASGLISLKPPDAIHLVSAVRAGCDEMHTFDERILNHHNRLPIDEDNNLRICRPGEVDDSGTLLEGLRNTSD